MNRRVVSAQINSFSTSALLLLLLLITILSGVMYLTVWQPQQRSIAGSVDLQRPGGLSLFQSRLNYSSHFRLCVCFTHSQWNPCHVRCLLCVKISGMKIVMMLFYVLANKSFFF